MDTMRESGDETQYLGFYIGSEEYAIGILRVKEILEYDTITKVPGAPASMRGVVNIRGSVVPVVDLAVKFGLPGSSVTKRTCIVVVEVDLEGERTVIGVMADSVSQVMDLGAGDIEPPPAFGTHVRLDYLLGMGKAGKRFILILDIDRVLSTTELQAAAAASLEADLPEEPATKPGSPQPVSNLHA